jgi:hypothetical protein
MDMTVGAGYIKLTAGEMDMTVGAEYINVT